MSGQLGGSPMNVGDLVKLNDTQSPTSLIGLVVEEKTISRYPGEMFYRILWNGVLPDGYTRNAKYTPGQLIKSL